MGPPYRTTLHSEKSCISASYKLPAKNAGGDAYSHRNHHIPSLITGMLWRLCGGSDILVITVPFKTGRVSIFFLTSNPRTNTHLAHVIYSYFVSIANIFLHSHAGLQVHNLNATQTRPMKLHYQNLKSESI